MRAPVRVWGWGRAQVRVCVRVAELRREQVLPPSHHHRG
jgi:hypothetical protein